ncbi:hypothetical protein O3G_MSEX011366 [Manduca sexta]|uniref:Uncharacterized protein n=1 Tax=Manduca sexta TaxID=7130 RepID=A0A922CV14_MANSE|nr:hypothetical protein O3G_MSEX011366 [Manduca sexta]KAG6459397.1 hypothetical protein O3G_MSEX011366 [Manduca sexta]KAG6459398.1 hypothetical protein O3G_MSEX011366 [Manduca sexta]
MAEPVTTQPNRNSGNNVELNDLNEEQLQAKRVTELREKEDDCCDSIFKCYCFEKCLRNCLTTNNDYESNSDDGYNDYVDDEYEARDDDTDNNEYQNNDNDFPSYNCDNNDFGASTCDADDSGGGDYGGYTTDD